MQSATFIYEQQIRHMAAEREARASRAQQLRLARESAASRVSMFGRIRVALGSSLIAAGQRMRADIVIDPIKAAQRA